MSIRFKTIVSAIEDTYDIPCNSIMSEERTKNIAEARMVAMYICRTLGGMTYVEIGEIFHRKHTTAMHACRFVKGMLKTKVFLQQYNALLKLIHRSSNVN
ncbi:Chromosomal replication initiator, DnaA C-terminal [uncultured Caudovirales phage]|uniref:Chromosomal replication initiator, DnaA C-terminal n=1 Tax=uncultured Caudovirales phage TaxID=2100421 RepID=A0A6J5KJ76_9CAUD|nr:Chromosomal replication initiator, DnaA C-terminal [uncultured Caudovirales phage]